MLPISPVNAWVLDIDRDIRENALKEVTSPLMFEPSSKTFHPEGLYSELIFGQVGTAQRISVPGYISLNCKILAPLIYLNLVAVASWYKDLMESKTYAVFDEKLKDFVPVAKDHPKARTGFSFFMDHIHKVELKKNNSLSRAYKIDACNKAFATKTHIWQQCLVIPAGWRDAKTDIMGRVEIDEVNKLFTSLLIMSKEIRTNIVSPELMQFFDPVKYHVQLKVLEIFNYLKNFLDGKTGYAQANYSKRRNALGTRNVITAPTFLAESPEDVNYQKHNETKVPLFQAAKAFELVVVHALNSLFYAPLYTLNSVQVPAINPKSLEIEYVEVTPAEVTYALDGKSKHDFINQFADKSIRHEPVSIKATNGKTYWLWMVYDLEDSIYIFRSLHDLQELLGAQEAIVRKRVKEDYYYHITTKTADDTIRLTPMIPPVDSSLEDKTIARVAVSDSIEGCIIAAHAIANEKPASVTVYRIPKSTIEDENLIKNHEIVEKKLVYDAEITHEAWILKPVQGEKVGTIHIDTDDVVETYHYTPITNVNPDWLDEEGKLKTYLFAYKWIDKVEKETEPAGFSEQIVDQSKLRPLTKIEMLYIATYVASHDKAATVTRFPAIEMGSIYPSIPVIMSTDPSRVVNFKSQYAEGADLVLPYYPKFAVDQYVDSTIPHAAKTVAMQADFDGDKTSFHGIMSKEAIEEAHNMLKSPLSVITPAGAFVDPISTQSTKFAIHALTYHPTPTAEFPKAEV